MTRLFFMTFHGKRRWTDDVHPHESPTVMTVPLMVLAVGSALLGLLLGPTGRARRTGSSRWSASTPRRTPVIAVPVLADA